MAAYAALVSLSHIIDNLHLHPRPPLSLNKNQAYLLTQKITFLQEFLEGYNPHLSYSTEADPLEIRIADAAYAAEDVIESHIVHSITNNGKKITSVGLYKGLKMVIEEMALIEKEAMEIKQTSVVPPDSSISSSSVAQKSSMVGADDILLAMKDKLTSHRLDLQIIPIVGMGGTGKTTLARNIYHDRLIKERFDICAWATISQKYSIQEILVEVLKQLIKKDTQDLSEGVLGEMLHKQLYGRRYMIVMDDMWSIDAWDGVRRFLPDNENGSRIVVTTRLSNLASVLSNSDNLEMKLLDEDDSWDLLSKTVFGEEVCPVELEEIGKEIGKSCKGLPLSIVVIGGVLLAKSEHTREFWEFIEKNLSTIVNSEDDERCLKILHMSYKHLPVYLKPCFLYMGVYPEDEVIRISKLIKLWVAEGFLKPISGKSLEEIARVYLKDLTDRNLVLIDKIGISGNIKQCKIHDLLRDLCLREAQKERFYTVIVGQTTPQGIVSGQHRVVVSSTTTKNAAINSLSSMSLVRSLKWDVDDQVVLPLSCRLLRILDSRRFRSTRDAEFLQNMHQLVNSRFLAISSPLLGCKFPYSIWNLQTLVVADAFPEVSAHTIIWYMPQIRHVDIYMLNLQDPPKDDIVLRNLQSLRMLKNFKCSQRVVKSIPNIKKLKISNEKGVGDDRYCLTNLDYLGELESLRCDFYKRINRRLLQCRINFPHSLKKLSLYINKSQGWEDILDKIGVLPLLQKLMLASGSFEEGEWETTEGQFRSLKFLSIIYCEGLQVWKTESSHFPCLEKLVLQGLLELEEIPLDFADLSTLKAIEIGLCSDSVVVSAKRIVDEQEDLYGEEAALQVDVMLDMKKNEALESLASPNFRVT